MFTQIEADVPLALPETTGCIHANLQIDVDSGTVTLSFDNEAFAERLLMQIRANNLLTLDLGMKYIDGKPKHV